MYTLKTKKIIFFVILLLSFAIYPALKFKEYSELKSFVNNYETGMEQELVVHAIDFYYSRFGILPFRDNSDFKELISELRIKYNNGNRFNFEQYPYEIILDTIKKEYVFYSFGPNEVSDQLKFLPFNTTERQYKFVANQISFIDYLKMSKDFDIILNRHELRYNCRKHISEIPSLVTKENVDNNREYFYEKYRQEVNEIKKRNEISSALGKNRDSTQNIVFTYNHRSLTCLCNGGLEEKTVKQIEDFLSHFLEDKFLDFEIVTFVLN